MTVVDTLPFAIGLPLTVGFVTILAGYFKHKIQKTNNKGNMMKKNAITPKENDRQVNVISLLDTLHGVGISATVTLS